MGWVSSVPARLLVKREKMIHIQPAIVPLVLLVEPHPRQDPHRPGEMLPDRAAHHAA